MNIINGIRSLFGGGSSATANSTTAAAVNTERTTRMTAFTRALEFFKGLIPAQLKVVDGQPDDNIAINYAEAIINKKVAFLFGKTLKISVGSTEDKTGEEQLEKLWSQAQRDEQFQEMAQDAMLAGDAYLKIIIEPSGAPSVSVEDPSTYEIITDPHNVFRTIGYRCTYPLGTNADGKPVLFKEETFKRDDGAAWTIDRFTSNDDGKTWQRTGDSLTWNFAHAPIFHAKNMPNPRTPYGKSDMTAPVMTIIKYISRLDSMCGKIVRLHSSPKAWTSGVKATELEWNADGVLHLGLGASGNQVPVERKIGLLEARGDLLGALALRKILREALAEMTGVPEIATGKVENVGQLSGVALRILYGPLIDQTELKQLRYGRMIRECVEALLKIANIQGKVELHWADPLPGNEKEQVEVAEAKQRIGFSQETLIRELGGDPEAERARRKFDTADTGAALLSAFDKGVEPEVGLIAKTADEINKLVNAAGALIRAGFSPEASLDAVGLDRIQHLGLLPVTLRNEAEIQSASV